MPSDHISAPALGKFTLPARIAAAAFATVLLLVPGAIFAGPNDERVLSFYNIHNKETLSVVYKRNGEFVPEALERLNWFARDWRRNEPTKMDAKLFDIIWEMHTELGSKEPVHLISGYRSPTTNEMLRKSQGGQAKNSRHKVGSAMDIHFPDVPAKRLRYSAMIRQRGGVGYYPTSAIPFVHVDTGRVRHWPRMPRAELALLFPDGKTQHRPPGDSPVTSRDAEQARAKYSQLAGEMDSWRMARLPLTGGNTMIASLNDGGTGRASSQAPRASASIVTASLSDRIPVPRVIGNGSTWDTQTIVASVAPPNTPLPSTETRNSATATSGSIAALLQRDAATSQPTPAVRPERSSTGLKLASLENPSNLRLQRSEPDISAKLIERQLRQDDAAVVGLPTPEPAPAPTAARPMPDIGTGRKPGLAEDKLPDPAIGLAKSDAEIAPPATEAPAAEDKDRTGLAALVSDSISKVANWFRSEPDTDAEDADAGSTGTNDGSTMIAINAPDASGVTGSDAREQRLAELTRIAGWTSAPEYDADHPEEFSYRAFPVGPLLTAEASIDDPILQQIVHPDFDAARAMLDPLEDNYVSTRFRPGIQIAGIAGWDRLSDQDVMNAVSQATRSDERGRPVKTAQQ